MRRTVAGLTLVLALALTGCSGDGSPTEPSNGAAATQAAAEEPLTIDAAAERFTQVTAPYEGVMVQFHEAQNAEEPLDKQIGLASATAAALRARVEGLRGTTWPEDVAADVATIADADEKAAAEWEAAGKAGTVDEAYEAAGRAMALNTLTENEAVRQALGISAAQ